MALGSGPVEFHVYGLCKIYVFTPLQYLGYTSEAGVQIEMDPKFLPIYTDAYGDQVPEDIQNMGMLATLTFELIKWDHTVLSVLQTHLPGATGNAPGGTLGNAPNTNTGANDILVGTLLKQCAYNFPLYLQRAGSVANVGCESNVEGPFYFSSCYLGPDAFNAGTKNLRHRLTVNCIPNASGQLFRIGSS